MRKYILWIALLVSLLFAGIADASGYYEDESLRLAISKGWNTLEDNTYIFAGSAPFVSEDHPSRLQDAIAKEYSGKLTKTQLEEVFKEEYIPIIVSALIKTEENRELHITHLYTSSESILVNELSGWERQNNRITKSIGAYYFLNVPPFLSYEIVFLVPKSYKDETLYVTFGATERFNKTLIAKSDSMSAINDRIQLLESEIARLKRLELE